MVKDLLLQAGIKLIKIIGEGGEAKVYLGHLVDFNITVAVKVLKGIDTETTIKMTMLEKFRREVDIWSKLRHPNIVKVYPLENIRVPVIVMEKCDKSLRSLLIEKTKIPWKDSLVIVIKLLSAIEYAHHFGVVHRDLKPENILFLNDEPKISDWGIAKIMIDLTKTKIKAIEPMTIAYAAPEQIDKKQFGDIDWRVDIWQMGCILYEMIAGELPFKGESPLELMNNILFSDPDPIKNIPESLWLVIKKALIKNKNARWQTATEMRLALETIAKGEKITVKIGDTSTQTLPTPEIVPPQKLSVDFLMQEAKRKRELIRQALEKMKITDIDHIEKATHIPQAEIFQILKEIDHVNSTVSPFIYDKSHYTTVKQKLIDATAKNAVLNINDIARTFSLLPPDVINVLNTSKFSKNIILTKNYIINTNLCSRELSNIIIRTVSKKMMKKNLLVKKVLDSSQYPQEVKNALFQHITRQIDTLVQQRKIFKYKDLIFDPTNLSSIMQILLELAKESENKIIYYESVFRELLDMGIDKQTINSAFSKLTREKKIIKISKLPKSVNLLKTFTSYKEIQLVSWSPDGSKIIFFSNMDDIIHVLDTTTWKLADALKGHKDWITTIAWSPDGSKIVSGSTDMKALIWDATTGALLKELTGHTLNIYLLTWSPDGTKIVSSSRDGTIRIWNAITGNLMNVLTDSTNSLFTSVAWSPDGSKIVSGSRNGTMRLWDSMSGKLLKTLNGHSQYIYSLAWSPDGSKIASGSRDKTIRIWDSMSGKLLKTLNGHNKRVFLVSWSLDGSNIISHCSDAIRIWDATSGKLLKTLTDHPNTTHSVALSPDGTKIASGSGDKTIRIWDAVTGRILNTITEHTDKITSLSWSPDGSKIVSGGQDKTIQIWDVRRTFFNLPEGMDIFIMNTMIFMLRSKYEEALLQYIEKYKLISLRTLALSIVANMSITKSLLSKDLKIIVDESVENAARDIIKSRNLDAEIIEGYLIQKEFLNKLIEKIDNGTSNKLLVISTWSLKLSIPQQLLKTIVETQLSTKIEIIDEYLVNKKLLTRLVDKIDDATRNKLFTLSTWAQKLSISEYLLWDIVSRRLWGHIKIIDGFLVNKEFKKENLKLPSILKSPERIAKLNNTTPSVIKCILFDGWNSYP